MSIRTAAERFSIITAGITPNPLEVENKRLTEENERLLEAIRSWRNRAFSMAEEHTAENGTHDPSTGVVEFGNEATEDHNCHLWEQLEELDAHFKVAPNQPDGQTF